MYKIDKKICAKWTWVDILTKVRKLLILNMKEQYLSRSPGQALGTAKTRSEEPKATSHNCVCDLQRIFYAGNSLFFLEIRKVFLRKTAFFHRKISS